MASRQDIALSEAANPPRENPSNVIVDYNKFKTNPLMIIRFIFECGCKLNAQPMTISTATLLFHKFRNATASTKDYDIYLIASACIYLSGKMESQLFKLRDVINVTRATIHRGSSPLDLNEGYWSARESIVQAELLLIRILKFDLTLHHPQKFLVHYLRTLEEWMGTEEWSRIPLARTSWAIVQDFHHDSSIIRYPPQAIAVAAMDLAMLAFGCTIPLCSSDGRNSWQTIFYAKFKRAENSEIVIKMLNLYEQELDVLRQSIFRDS